VCVCVWDRASKTNDAYVRGKGSMCTCMS
jgi:hypothetical protein